MALCKTVSSSCECAMSKLLSVLLKCVFSLARKVNLVWRIYFDRVSHFLIDVNQVNNPAVMSVIDCR